MENIFHGSIARHDPKAGITYLAWQGMTVRAPLSEHLLIGASVTWEMPAEQVRLPSNSKRPERPLDTPLAVTVVRIESHGHNIHAVCATQPRDGCQVVVIVDAGIARDHGVVEGASLVLRLRGEHIRIQQLACSTY